MCEHGLQPQPPFWKQKDRFYDIAQLTPPKGSRNMSEQLSLRWSSELFYAYPGKSSLPENIPASALPALHKRQDEEDPCHLWTSCYKWMRILGKD